MNDKLKEKVLDIASDLFFDDISIEVGTEKILALIYQALNDCLPENDIDEELSARYDLVIPQGVHGFRVAIDQIKRNLINKLGTK